MKKAAMGLALGGLLAPNMASAEPDYIVLPGVGVVFQENSSGEWETGLAFEVSANYEGYPVYGVFGQVEFFSSDDIRVAIGGQVSVGVGLETALSFRFSGGEIIPGLQLAPFVSALYGYGTFRTLFESQGVLFGVSGGLKLPLQGNFRGDWELFDPFARMVVDGRPLRDADGARFPIRVAWLGPESAPAVDARIGRAWVAAAAEEHAAVGAFTQLAVWLARLDAPDTLVARARQAAIEEQGHAESAFAIASRLLGVPVAPVAALCPIAPTPSLAQLAVTNLLDGRLNEGVAAREALAALAETSDPEIRAHLEAVVVEERGHAVLADDIEAWARRAGGSAVAAAVEAALAAVTVPVFEPADGETLDAWRSMGRVTASTTGRAYVAELARVRGDVV